MPSYSSKVYLTRTIIFLLKGVLFGSINKKGGLKLGL